MSMIRTEHLAKSFGELVVLKDINLTVESGEVVVIIGPSGAGKSTFLRSLNNLEKITSGKIFIEDKLFYNPSVCSLHSHPPPLSGQAYCVELALTKTLPTNLRHLSVISD